MLGRGESRQGEPSSKAVASSDGCNSSLDRRVGFLIAILAPFGLALVTVRILAPPHDLKLLAGSLIGLYVLYAIGIIAYFPRNRVAAGRAPSGIETAVPINELRRSIDWLLLLRGLAAALVFIMHSGIVFGHDWTFGHSQWAWIALSPAWLGMLMFFTLSGYLMGKSFYERKYDETRPGVWLYLRNRFLRIVPLTFTVALLIVLLQPPDWLFSSGLASQLGIRIGMFSFNGALAPTGLGAFWSLSTEWQFYLTVPLVFVIARKILRGNSLVKLSAVTVLVMAGGICIRWFSWSRHSGSAGFDPWVYTPLYANFDVFILGFITNWWRPHFKSIGGLMARSWPLLLIVVYLGYSFISYRAAILGDVHLGPTFALILPAVTALLLVPVIVGMESLNLRESVRSQHRRRTAFVLYWIGALTFPVYLVHTGILEQIELWIPHSPYLERWALGIIFTFLVAWLLHITIEKAVLRWRRQHSKPGFSPTYGRLLGRLGLMRTTDVKELEQEHSRLKQVAADQALLIMALESEAEESDVHP